MQTERDILKFLVEQPDGLCRINWLPEDLNFAAYRNCRDCNWLRERNARDGFKIVVITEAGRLALQDGEGR